MKSFTKQPPPYVANPPLLPEDYPRLFMLGKWTAGAMSCTLELIAPYDHNQVGMKAYLDKLGFTFIFRNGEDRVYVSLSGEALLGCTDQQIIAGMKKQIQELSRA